MSFVATAYICKGGSKGEQMKTKTMYVPVATGQRYHVGRGYSLQRSNVFLISLSVTINIFSNN